MPGGRPSLRFNVAANYVGQLYVAAINLLLLPVQIRLLGSEAYGLVGFFAMLSAWLQLLDLGLSPTLSRETAKYRAGALDASSYLQLLHSANAFFLLLGSTAATLVFGLSGVISRRWLHGVSLTPTAVATAVALMGVVFAFRWQATLSRSVLVGLERQVWLNATNAAFATLRSVGVLAILRWVEPTPRAFFAYQAAVAALELLVLRTIVGRSLGQGPAVRIRLSFAPLRNVAGFSLTVAMTSFLWISITQLDSLLLSKILPLAEYAWFAIAVMAANGITLLAGPIGQAAQPRLTYYSAVGDHGAFRRTYSDITQLLAAIALTASLAVAFGARHLLWAWTGNAALADRTAPVLGFYAIGNGLLAVVAMTYYLQIARGDLRLHLRGNLVFAALQLPFVVIATLRAGMLGAAVAWCVVNLAYLAIWSAIVHRRFLPGIHARWLVIDTLLPCLVGCIPLPLFWVLPWSSLGRLETAFALAGLLALSVGMALISTRPARRLALAVLNHSNRREAM